ncbi:MAG: isoprenylcysteine carboxylmethyltransferase family protein [Bdellovibrionota bacterium]
MIKKIIETVPLVLIAVVLPLVGRLELLTTWPVMVVAMYGVLLNLSQPSLNLKKESSDRHDRSSMILIIVGALLCFIIPLADFAYGRPRVILFSQAATWVALILIWGGFIFRVWSIRVLDRFFTAKVVIQSDHQLIRSGPYRYLRHPSYLGAWISQIGISLFFQSVIGLIFSVMINFVIYAYRIHCEEKALTEMFPSEYPEYKKTTSGILPLIY